MAPGCKESVLFASDGYTLLDDANKETQEKESGGDNVDIDIKINLEEVVDSNVHLVGEALKHPFTFKLEEKNILHKLRHT